MLISRPIHARSQWELEKVIVVPSPSDSKNKVAIRGFTRKGGRLVPIFEAWAQ